MLDSINHHLAVHGIRIVAGMIVDATIIAAPCSTIHKIGERDPKMHQTKKGTLWHFGLKAHIQKLRNGYAHFSIDSDDGSGQKAHAFSSNGELVRTYSVV